MNFIEFTKIIDRDKIIDIRNVANYFDGIDRRRLYEWQKKGYLQKIANNFYCLSDTSADDDFLKSIACKIYTPSYVGLESALAYYGLIPEAVFQTIAVTTRRNKVFKTKSGDFTYRSIKNSLFFGYKVIESARGAFYISDPEKTLLDFFYFSVGADDPAFIQETRLNVAETREIIHIEKLKDYLKLFASKKVAKACERLMELVDVKL